jgi:hypothetical protein
MKPTVHFKSRLALSLVISGATLLQACGGGGGGGGGSDEVSVIPNDNPGGVAVYAPTTTNYLGTISGLGSIVVNGVRFETTSASVLDSDDLYGSTAYSSPLTLGMTVALQGDADESQSLGRAQKIRLVGGVRGTMTAYTAGASMVVGGQTVALNANTLYVNAAGQPVTLQANDFVNVYGLMQADNSFLATRVIQSSAANSILDAAWRGQSSGVLTSSAGDVVLNLDTGGGTAYTVSCPVATCSVQPSRAALTGTHAVRVLSSDDTQRTVINGVTTVAASRIQVLDASQLLAWDGSSVGRTKIKGVATTNGSQWFVAGVPVISSLPWVTGAFYEVKGTLTNGQLTVTQRELEGQESYREVVNGGTRSYYRNELYGAVSQLQGNIVTVQGVTVDLSQAYFERGSLATIANGDYVEVKGTLSGGQMLASKVEVKTSSVAGQGTRFEVYGTVSQLTQSGFALSSGNTQYTTVLNGQSRIDNSHGVLANGQFVEVKGYMNGTAFVVLKVEVKSSHGND